MENLQDGYLLVDSVGKDSQLFTARRLFKVGATFVVASCLVLCILGSSVTQRNSNAADSTNLVSLVNAKSGPISQPFMGNLPHHLSHIPTQTRKSIVAFSDYRQGDSAEYYSTSNGDWIPCKILAINSKGDVKISVKANEWMNEATQAKNLRKKNTFFGFSFGNSKFKDPDQYKRMKYKDVDTGPGYSWDSESMTEAYARVRESRQAFAERERRAQEAKEAGGAAQLFNQLTGALDFKEDIKADRGLIKAAKQLRKGEKLTGAEYGAIKRKVGGTKDGFFGETVEVVGKYTEKGYVDESSSLPKWLSKLR